jgi:hypothetical protein
MRRGFGVRVGCGESASRAGRTASVAVLGAGTRPPKSKEPNQASRGRLSWDGSRWCRLTTLVSRNERRPRPMRFIAFTASYRLDRQSLPRTGSGGRRSLPKPQGPHNEGEHLYATMQTP